MSIRCGHCKGHHASVREVRECSGGQAPRVDSPSDTANRVAARLRQALVCEAQRLADQGVYRFQGEIYRVRVLRNGNRVAEWLCGGVYLYAKGMVYRLRPEHRLTLEQAIEWGHQHTACIRCGTELTDPKSIARGIGPVCAGLI